MISILAFGYMRVWTCHRATNLLEWWKLLVQTHEMRWVQLWREYFVGFFRNRGVISHFLLESKGTKRGVKKTYGAPARSTLLFLMGSDMATDQKRRTVGIRDFSVEVGGRYRVVGGKGREG